MADIKVSCVSIRCDQTPGYGMEVLLEKVDTEKLEEYLLSEYKEDTYTVISNLEYEGIMSDNERLEEENDKLRQKIKNLRGKLNDKAN